MKTLVILAHPSLENSRVNQRCLPYFAVFGASFQASDEEINTSAKEYINYIFKHHI